MYASTNSISTITERGFLIRLVNVRQKEELTNQSVPCCFVHIHQVTLVADSPEEILAALVNSPFSMQVIRVLLSSTVLRRAAGGRPLPLLDTMTVLKETRGKCFRNTSCVCVCDGRIVLRCRSVFNSTS